MALPNRQRGRQLALQALYAGDIAGHSAVTALERLLQEERNTADVAETARRLVAGVVSSQESIDGMIAAAAPLWPFAQMAAIDRNVLRLATYALALEPGQALPEAVLINEAVELAKRFGSDGSARFVNGVLGTLARSAGAQRHSVVNTP